MRNEAIAIVVLVVIVHVVVFPGFQSPPATTLETSPLSQDSSPDSRREDGRGDSSPPSPALLSPPCGRQCAFVEQVLRADRTRHQGTRKQAPDADGFSKGENEMSSTKRVICLFTTSDNLFSEPVHRLTLAAGAFLAHFSLAADNDTSRLSGQFPLLPGGQLEGTDNQTFAAYRGTSIFYMIRLFGLHFPQHRCHVISIDMNATLAAVPDATIIPRLLAFLRATTLRPKSSEPTLWALAGTVSDMWIEQITSELPTAWNFTCADDQAIASETSSKNETAMVTSEALKVAFCLLSLRKGAVMLPDALASALETGSWHLHANLTDYNVFNAVLKSEALRLADVVITRIKKRAILGIEGGSYELNHERKIYMTIAQQPQVNRICEIGFNAGHSAALWLRANPNASVVMFDLFHHRYSRLAESFIRVNGSDFGLVDVTRRLATIAGSSLVSVPKFHEDFPNISCEVLSVDGGHFKDVPLRDMLNMMHLASKGFNILLVDDTNCDEHYCMPANRAVDHLEREGLAVVVARLSEIGPNVVPGTFNRGVTVLQYTPQATTAPSKELP